MGRGDCAAVGGTGGQESSEQAGGNAPRRIATTRCSGSQEVLHKESQVRHLWRRLLLGPGEPR